MLFLVFFFFEHVCCLSVTLCNLHTHTNTHSQTHSAFLSLSLCSKEDEQEPTLVPERGRRRKVDSSKSGGGSGLFIQSLSCMKEGG